MEHASPAGIDAAVSRSERGQAHTRYRGSVEGEGVQRGVPDISLPAARLGYHGLWIEMKCHGGRVSEVQKYWIAALRDQGYRVEVCWTWLEAVNEIETYLTWEVTDE